MSDFPENPHRCTGYCKAVPNLMFSYGLREEDKKHHAWEEWKKQFAGYLSPEEVEAKVDKSILKTIEFNKVYQDEAVRRWVWLAQLDALYGVRDQVVKGHLLTADQAERRIAEAVKAERLRLTQNIINEVCRSSDCCQTLMRYVNEEVLGQELEGGKP